MSLDEISVERLSQCHPELGRRVMSLCEALEAEGYVPRVTAGIRTVAQQDALWQQGRDANGNVIGKTVTNAKGTQSNHTLGYAADLTFMDSGQPDWDSSGFDRVIVLAEQYGLRSGSHWGDKPHVELIEVPAIPTGEAQQTYLEAGVEAVWAAFPIPA